MRIGGLAGRPIRTVARSPGSLAQLYGTTCGLTTTAPCGLRFRSVGYTEGCGTGGAKAAKGWPSLSQDRSNGPNRSSGVDLERKPTRSEVSASGQFIPPQAAVRSPLGNRTARHRPPSRHRLRYLSAEMLKFSTSGGSRCHFCPRRRRPLTTAGQGHDCVSACAASVLPRSARGRLWHRMGWFRYYWTPSVLWRE